MSPSSVGQGMEREGSARDCATLDVVTSGRTIPEAAGPRHAPCGATATLDPIGSREMNSATTCFRVAGPGSHPKQGVQVVHPRSLATPWLVGAGNGDT